MRTIIFNCLLFIGLIAPVSSALATCTSYPSMLANGTMADASQVMANFNCAALTSDSTINNLTLAGTTTLPGSGVIDSNGVINSKNYVLPDAGSSAKWAQVGTFTAPQSGSTIRIVAYIHQGYNASNGQDSVYYITFKTSNGGSVDGHGFAGNGSWYAIGFNGGIPIGSIKWKANVGGVSATSFDLYILLPVYTLNSHYAVSVSNNAKWTNIGVIPASDPGAASASVLIPATEFDIPTGNVGINTTGPAYTLQVNGSVAGASAYVNLSDARLKKNIRPIGDALGKIIRLQGVEFEWRTPNERPVGKKFKLPADVKQVGFIAQDMEKVLPEAVSTANNHEAIMSVAESKIVPVLVEAIKELKRKNDQQATELSQLKVRMGNLEHEFGERALK